MKGTEEKVEYARKIILEVYEEDTSKIAFIALQFWDTDSDGSKTFRVSDWLSYSGFLSIITALPFFTMYSVVGKSKVEVAVANIEMQKPPYNSVRSSLVLINKVLI
ncbi:hypothetical protein L3Y34_005994 [Caenorhabditis briggsae]|uniref:Uncharacterized protein n=1 Tax=Caenorhabditis briggsae TaxID=6238 RepID=A0AAE8ZVS8_CAEBR|nr:hypothetical protein L3Y34_005994 [Caenorhabditis briggsae]